MNEGRSMIYEEKAPYSDAMKIIIMLGFSALALLYFFSVFGHFVGVKKASDQAQFVLLSVTIIYYLVMWSFFSIRFRITNKDVEAVMPPFKYRIPFSEIKGVNTIDSIPWYIGWGVRLWGRRLGFVSMHKKAVVIEKKKGFFRELILTTGSPEEFVHLIREEMR